MALPEVIPLFPLPNLVFFPRMPLPLHVFEPRYRQMTRDAAAGHRLIGMVLLRDGWQQAYEGRPPVFDVGTVGEMVRAEELPDGRFNIVLRGVREFTIERELPPRTPYREAAVRWRPAGPGTLPPGRRAAIAALVQRWLARLGQPAAADRLLSEPLDDETFVNFFAQQLDLSPIEKQALLEAPGLPARAERLADVLEFRLEELRLNAGGPGWRAQ